VSLRGIWKINVDPPVEFWNNAVDPASWADIRVPGYASTQGIFVTRGRQYAYKTEFTVPSNFAGKRVFLRFEGVTGQANVWVNGAFIRDHFGGYTVWNCEITDHVSSGQEAWLTLGVTDTTDGITSLNVGGILRDIKLVAVPQDCLTRFNIETDLDRSYQNAVLKIWVAMDFHRNSNAQVQLSLKDVQGKPVPLEPASVELTREQAETIAEIPVAAPVKWDAEHPNLYTMEARVVEGDATLETVTRQIGFRKIERTGRRLLVNGKEVKLRGINHQDTYAPTGRAVTPEQSEQAVRLYRDANINLVRTGHYPMVEEFLDACDRYGMYVEEQTSVSSIRTVGGVQDNAAYKPHFLNQLAEEIEEDRSHPSVLMWSMSNESFWGRNIRDEFAYAKTEDPSRPTIVSYSYVPPAFTYIFQMPQGEQAPYDIFSLHYASYSRDLSAGGQNAPADKETDGASRSMHIPQPVLHDEWAHVPCYDTDELRRDPGIRNFYGESIKRFWENLFPTEGALGGAIWAGIDDFFKIDKTNYTSFEWGILDTWRREKPEYWLVKKAYSPVRIEDKPVPNPGSGNTLEIPIKNWFDHTNLSELRIAWSVGQESGTLAGPNVEPHADGTLRLPARSWKDGDVLNLKFFRLGDLLVDEFNLPVNPPPHVLPQPQGLAPTVQEGQDEITVSGTNFSLVFSKKTGLITRGSYNGTGIIESGPYLQLGGGQELPAWSLKSVQAAREANEAVVNLSGNYGPTAVSFELQIDGQGLISTKYTLDALPELKRPILHGPFGDVGGYWEVGVSYILTADVDRLAWHRKGLWSVYPETHIGRLTGVANREGKGASGRLLVAPTWPWSEDEKDYFKYGPYDIGGRGTNDFRSMKENIYYASAIVRGTQNRIQAESNGSDAVRLEVLDDPQGLIMFSDPRIKLTGSWKKTDKDIRSEHTGDSVELAFQGDAISWLGTLGESEGMADVYIDGKLAESGVNVYAPSVEEVVHRTVLDKRAGLPREILYSKEGLAAGQHTIKVVVTGKKSAPSTGTIVTVGGFRVLNGRSRGMVRFIINNEWNYPQLGWGNYVKDPVLIKAGYSNQVLLRFRDRDEVGDRPLRTGGGKKRGVGAERIGDPAGKSARGRTTVWKYRCNGSWGRRLDLLRQSTRWIAAFQPS
jgi:hypothetical protein